jgi:hypothetical protein
MAETRSFQGQNKTLLALVHLWGKMNLYGSPIHRKELSTARSIPHVDGILPGGQRQMYCISRPNGWSQKIPETQTSFRIKMALPFLTGNRKTSATNFANSHEFLKLFAKIRVNSWQRNCFYNAIPPKTGEP